MKRGVRAPDEKAMGSADATNGKDPLLLVTQLNPLKATHLKTTYSVRLTSIVYLLARTSIVVNRKINCFESLETL